MADEQVIGKDGDMPWHLPQELQYFKEITMGKPIVMGRNTFASIGRALPGRRNVVITSKPELLPENVDAVASPEKAMELLQDHDEIMIIGGGQIYKAFLPLATRMYLTHIDLTVDGDTFFPQWNENEWSRQELRKSPKVDVKTPGYAAYLYEKST
ncbi:dihydrofolate reductase [Aliidiomarina sp. B3213]